MAGVLYLIPTTLGESKIDKVLPSENNSITRKLRYFIVEDLRTARRFLKKIDPAFPINDSTFFLLNKHTSSKEFANFLSPIENENSIGIISEAGCPAIADPGADIVKIAQQKKIKVVPLVGPSSILLALMGSGFNGQSFSFLGYLPIEKNERVKILKKIEKTAYAEDQTQLFIETPYRNMKTLEDILKNCQANTQLCIAVDLTLTDESIKTKKINDWKKSLPDLHKRPCIFAIYKG